MLSACAVGPNYTRPDARAPAAFKEAPSPQNGWVISQPMDTLDRGAWWSGFGDAVLDGLERKVVVSNQNVAEAVAAYDQARALTSADRASLLPTLTASGSGERAGGGGGGRSGGGSTVTSSGTIISGSGGGSYAASSFASSLGASWAPDLWGRIRRQVQSDRAAAQASAADLANATLSAQTELASDYVTLRILDADRKLYADTVAADQKAYDVTLNKYNAGVSAKADVITAQTQLITAKAQLADVEVQRQQNEHAIAVLAGMAPSELSISPVETLNRTVPTPPVMVPTEVLQRRPDIASAERSAASASALIGVQVAAYFPTITLSGSYGYNSTGLSSLFNSSSDVWSYGLNLADTLVDFGARQARVRQAKALYRERVAAYRQTVLTAFQNVEDQLVALRVLGREAVLRDQALASARQAEQLALNEYKAGTVDYTTVVQAQNTSLQAGQSALQILQQEQLASVALIEALGGGWSQTDLPKQR